VVASKPVTIFGVITVPVAVFIYAITFTLIDLINERLGKAKSMYVVYASFAVNLIFALYARLAIAMPGASFYTDQVAFATVLGSTWRIVAAGLIAYLVSSLIDVQAFAVLKNTGLKKWARVMGSNGASTLVDSCVFIFIAFYGVMPIGQLIVGQYVVKMLITVISIPLIYIISDAR